MFIRNDALVCSIDNVSVCGHWAVFPLVLCVCSIDNVSVLWAVFPLVLCVSNIDNVSVYGQFFHWFSVSPLLTMFPCVGNFSTYSLCLH